MAKRLNPKRRRKLSRSIALQLKGKSLNPSMVAEVGHIRSSTGKAKREKIDEAFAIPLYQRSPKPVNLDAPGKIGRVVKGKFVPKAKYKPFDRS